MTEDTPRQSSQQNPPADVVERFTLTPDEDLVLSTWQYRMMQRDVATTKSKDLASKRVARDDFRSRAVEVIESTDLGSYRRPQAQQLAASIHANGPESRSKSFQELETAAPELDNIVTQRSRAMLLLIDLYGFEPWPRTTWSKDVRQSSVGNFHQTLSPLHEEDLLAVANAYQTSVKALAAKNRRWGRVALFGAAGLGLGILSGGLAAPAIGTLYGTAVLGYSGAVATSAGLASLGGGSLAAGGLGMAGGTALIAGAGGAAGLGVLSAGARTAGFTAGQVAADVVRLEVATQLVLRDIEGDEQAAKAVVLALREKMVALGSQLMELTRRIEELKAERDDAVAALKEEREARVSQEKKLKQLRAHLQPYSSDEETESVKYIDEELRNLEQQKRANRLVSDFVESRAEHLDRAA